MYMKIANLVISLFVLISCNKGNSMQDIATSRGPGNDSSVIRILSYNIRHGAPIHHSMDDVHLDGIVAAINAQKPDLVALQEVDVHTKRSGVDVNQAEELGRLTGMNYYFSKSIDYQGGEYGIAILSRFPILAHERYSLPMPDATGERRSVAIVRVEVFPGVEVEFASTHLDLKSVNRLAQVSELITIARGSKYPFVIAGDFNSRPEDAEIKNLQQEFTLSCISKCPYTSPSDNPRATIDYIMFNPSAAKIFNVISYNAIQGVAASDHAPLVGEYSKK